MVQNAATRGSSSEIPYMVVQNDGVSGFVIIVVTQLTPIQ